MFLILSGCTLLPPILMKNKGKTAERFMRAKLEEAYLEWQIDDGG